MKTLPLKATIEQSLKVRNSVECKFMKNSKAIRMLLSCFHWMFKWLNSCLAVWQPGFCFCSMFFRFLVFFSLTWLYKKGYNKAKCYIALGIISLYTRTFWYSVAVVYGRRIFFFFICLLCNNVCIWFAFSTGFSVFVAHYF